MEGLAVLLIVLGGIVIALSSMFSRRTQERIYRGLGGIAGLLVALAIFWNPLMGFLRAVVGFLVEWLIRLLAIGFGAGVIYMIYRFFTRR